MDPTTRYTRKSYARGFLTLEIMIALVLMILSITAVVLVAFGNQDILVGTYSNAEATQKGEELLERAQSLARKDFNSVNPIATSTDGIYRTSLSVEPPTSSEYFSKKVTAHIAWSDDRRLTHNVSLSTIVTDFLNAVGGDTCSSALSGDWTSPQVKNTLTDFATLINRAGDVFSVTDLDAYKGKLYVTVGHTPDKSDPTFFVFDTSDPTNLMLVSGGSYDNASSTLDGLAAVSVAGKYAYVANNHSANFNTCTNPSGQNTACAQMQMIGIQGSPDLAYSFKVPGVTSSSGGVGSSIFYKGGYVYLGLTSTGGRGPEFHIIDVHNFPVTPPTVVGSYTTNAGINAIYVKDDFAYLATTNSAGTLTILDVSDPARPVLLYTPITASFGNGKSVFQGGDTLYFGKTADPNTSELYIYRNANPAGTAPTLASTTEIGSSINGIRARDSLFFLLDSSKLQIWNATSSAHVALPIPGAGSTSSNYQPFFDCEGDRFYVGANNTTNQGALSVITSSP